MVGELSAEKAEIMGSAYPEQGHSQVESQLCGYEAFDRIKYAGPSCRALADQLALRLECMGGEIQSIAPDQPEIDVLLHVISRRLGTRRVLRVELRGEVVYLVKYLDGFKRRV